ncbi:MAG: peptidoglycan DD-metalloendopeptidase family protein [Candidatus Saccharimonadales bacterium]
MKKHHRQRWLASLGTCAIALSMSSCALLGDALNLCTTESLLTIQPAKQELVSTAGLSPSQIQFAQTIAGVAASKGLPSFAQLVAVATAIQETNLHNEPKLRSDGSSAGLFQQTDIYGPESDRMMPVWATNAFLFGVTARNGSHISGLVDIKDWQTMDAQRLAESVQRPRNWGTPQSVYNSPKHNFANSLQLAEALLGTTASTRADETDVVQTASSLNCVPDKGMLSGLMLALRSQIGVMYSWGGEDPATGFDCSGLTQWAFRQIGITLPRGATDQWRATTEVPGARAPSDGLSAETFKSIVAKLRPGDLVFFAKKGNPGIMEHVGVYVGNGEFIDAPRTGKPIAQRPLYFDAGSVEYFTATRPLPVSDVNSQLPISANGIGMPLATMRLTSDCGMRVNPVTRIYTLHNGQDFGLTTGTSVTSIQDGKVVAASSDTAAGNYVKVQHPDSRGRTVVSGYLHLSAINVVVGQTVTKGQVIGLGGSTGRSTGPHLHFIVSVDDVPVQGLEWITSGGITVNDCRKRIS